LSNFYDRGFFASEGWDPVTGLGNPNFPPLLELAMNAAIDKVNYKKYSTIFLDIFI